MLAFAMARDGQIGLDVADDLVKRREYYLSKIKLAEQLALKTSNADTLHDLETVIEGYRKLLARLRTPQSEH